MAHEQTQQLLHQAIVTAREGRSDAARPMLQQVVRADPGNEIAWMWLSSVAADDKERLFCLRKLLELNPQNEYALKGLRALGAQPTRGTGTPVGTSVPVLDEAKYARAMEAADEFLRRYNPQPPDRLDLRWTHRQRGRYGESGARRLRQTMIAVVTLLVIGLVGGAAYLASVTDIFGEEGTAVGALSTRLPSQTPLATFTPTPGGPTPTPFPATMDVPPTRVPVGLTRQGNPYGLASPTAIYPRVEANVARLIEDAVNHYSIGDYQEALRLLQEEHERSRPHCYTSLVYYEALSHAALGSYREARNLLEEARNSEPPRGYASCKDEPLLLAGLAQVAYLQDEGSEDARALAEEALEADPKLVAATLVKARWELARGEPAAARGTVAQALLEWPEDTNLLVMAAEIELADGQPASALQYIGQALYIEPALQPALYRQADAYLMLAAQSSPGTDRQLQYYGLAVLSAQTILLYYPGDPAGYLYLAKARIGEANDDLAETALDRIIAVEKDLPDRAQAVVRDAHQLRAELRRAQGRLDEARVDYERIAFAASGGLDTTVAEKLVEIAFATDDYAEAERWISQLLFVDPDNPTYNLWQARALVEDCTFFPGELTCDYRTMLRRLSDSFVASLSSEDQRADAYSYRAQAQYWDTLNRGGAISQGQRQLALQLALNDNTQALMLRESAVDHYYRGLILEALDEPARALEAYRWVSYWSDLYPYPFRGDDLDERMAAMVERVEDLSAVTATPVAPVTPGAEPQGSPSPSPAVPSATPVPAGPTPLPSGTPGPLPDAPIP